MKVFCNFYIMERPKVAPTPSLLFFYNKQAASLRYLSGYPTI